MAKKNFNPTKSEGKDSCTQGGSETISNLSRPVNPQQASTYTIK